MNKSGPKYLRDVPCMGLALRRIRQEPGRNYWGWNWYETPGHFILAEFRRGLHDRINRRAGK